MKQTQLTSRRFFEGLVHMGYPDSLPVAYKWLEEVLSPNAVPLKS